MPPKREFDVSFRVNDTPYGRAADLDSRGKVFVPQIAKEGVHLQGAAQGIFVRAARDSAEIITVSELHHRYLQNAKRNAPASICVSLEEQRVNAMDDARATYNTVFRDGGFSVTPNESFNRWIFESLVWEAVDPEYCVSRRRDPLMPTACRLSSGLMREMVDDKAKQPAPICDLPQSVFETLCSGIAIRAANMVSQKAEQLHKELETMKMMNNHRTDTATDNNNNNNNNNNNDDDASEQQQHQQQLPHPKQSATLVIEEVKNDVAHQDGSDAVSADAAKCSESSGTHDVAVIAYQGTSHEVLASYAQKFTNMFAAFNNKAAAATTTTRDEDDDDNDQEHKQKEDEESAQGEPETLADRLFCMLQRYRALARGPNREKAREGSGHHSATPPTVLNKLRDVAGVQMECFASPFNSHFPYFCSAFRDTDCFFGSVGSFFEFFPVEGSFEVGPPYVEELMEQMRVHLVELLSGSDRPLSFTMIVPDWVTDPQSDGKKIRETPAPSSSLRSIYANDDGFTRLVIQVKDHAFLDGFQHTFRRPLFRPPNPTLVMIMQNEAGATKWPVSEKVTSAAVKNEWAEAAKGVQEMVYFVRPGQHQQHGNKSNNQKFQQYRRDRS